MADGFFCVIEGIDGSGKTSLIQALRDNLMETDMNLNFGNSYHGYVILCEPTHGPTGRRIREHLKRNDQMSRQQWLDLFYTDRSVNVDQNIRPALARGELIFQDRYYFSTAAYQGEVKSDPKARDIVKDSEKAGFPAPDLIVYLDISPKEAMERITKSRDHTESFEKLQVLEQIHHNYEQILDRKFLQQDTKHLNKTSILKLDATQPIESHIKEIFHHIYKHIVTTRNIGSIRTI